MYSIRELAEKLKNAFPGAVTISSSTGSQESNVILDITGSGYLIAVNNATTTSRAFTVQLDGGPIMKFTIVSLGLGMFPLRFEQRLRVRCATTGSLSIFALAVLD